MMTMDAIKSILAITTTEAPVAAVVERRIVLLPQGLVVVPCSKLIITHLQEGKASNPPPNLPLLLLLRSFILRIAFHPVIQITTTIRPTTTSQRILMVDLPQLPDHCSHHHHHHLLLLLLYPSQQISSCLITSRLYRRHHHPSLRTIMN